MADRRAGVLRSHLRAAATPAAAAGCAAAPFDAAAAAVESLGSVVRQSQPVSRRTGTAATWFAQERKGEVYATPVLGTKVNRDSAEYKARLQRNTALCTELRRRLRVAASGGGGKYEKLHRSRGKNLVRERISKIIDPGSSFLELSPLAAWGMYGGDVHSGGRCTGIGLVAGRECLFIGTDATIKGGVIFPLGMKKCDRAQLIAEANHLPCIYLIDGGGAKLDSTASTGKAVGKKKKQTRTAEARSYDQGGVSAGLGEGGGEFYNQARMSGKGIPQIAVVCGMCTAGGAYTPAMCDETIIVEKNGTVYLGGPPLVKAATGEDAEEQSLGGAVMHTTKSGTCDHYAKDEEIAMALCREVLENTTQRRPRVELPGCQEPAPPLHDPEELLGIIPEDTATPFDIREVVGRVVDGSRFHEFKARYGPTLVCGWAHIEGYPVGIVANNGLLYSEACMKAAQFAQVCGHRGAPIVFLHNIAGFSVGTQFEQGGITKDSAKMMNAIANAPVPKFTVICGASYGAGNMAMCGKGMGPRFVFTWPNARVGGKGGEQVAAEAAYELQKKRQESGQPPLSDAELKALQAPVIAEVNEMNSAFNSTAFVNDDGMIDPRDTRRVLSQAISASLNAPMPETRYAPFRL